MPRYSTTAAFEAAGIPPSTGWRRMVRLAAEGKLTRHIRTGGLAGSWSEVEFPGTFEELVPLLRLQPPRSHIAQHCPTCGQVVHPTLDGPPCPKCGMRTDVSSGRVWCRNCRESPSISSRVAPVVVTPVSNPVLRVSVVPR